MGSKELTPNKTTLIMPRDWDAEDRANAPTASAQTASAITAPRIRGTLTLNRPVQSVKPPTSMDSAASRTPREEEGEVGIDKTAASPPKTCIYTYRIQRCCIFCVKKQ